LRAHQLEVLPPGLYNSMSMSLSYRDIVSSGAIRRTSEAVGLVLAAMDVCEKRSSGQNQCLPNADRIALDCRGRVSFTADPLETMSADAVRQIAELLRQMLGLADGPGASRAEIPGALLLLIARSCGEIDLPAPSYLAVRDVLVRFGSHDETMLSSLYRRVSRQRLSEPARLPWIRRHRTALAASLAAVVMIGSAAMWRGYGRTAIAPTDDAVRIETVDVRVPGHRWVALDASPKTLEWVTATVRPLLASTAVGTDVFSPSLARRGDVLLFHSGRDKSALMRATFQDTGTLVLTTLLRDGAANYHATLSPDEQWLAYDSDVDGTRAVYVARADGREPRKISGHGHGAVPRWSPDGGHVAFIKAESARPRVWNVWVADLSTGTLSRVSRHAVGQAWGASWFPDGHRIAYSVEDRLVLADLTDGTTRIVRSPVAGRRVRTPAVSPDGQRVVFQVHRDGTWLLDVATGAMRRVIADRTAEEFSWSPDGRRVVFHTRQRGAWSVWELRLNADEAG
jgi:Tol biopolymer transport system component